MGKAFGIVSLVLGIIGILGAILIGFRIFLLPAVIGFIIIFASSVIAIVFGGIGVAKDDSKGMGIAGLLLGAVAFVLAFIEAVSVFIFDFYFTFGLVF